MSPAEFDLDAIRAAAVASGLERLDDVIPDSARTFCTVETTVVEGAAYRQVLRIAAEQRTDLIVMGGARARDVGRVALGSNTARVTRAAPCPVLVIRQPR